MYKYVVLPILVTLVALCAHAQYYLKGEVRNDKGETLQNIKFTVASKGSFPFYSGSSGTFGIPTRLKVDTITFYADGFDTLKAAVVTTEFKTFVLKQSNRQAKLSTLQLLSLTTDLAPTIPESIEQEGETYTSTVENAFVAASQFPQTGFALNVDRASYSNVRRFLNSKELPPVDAVRIEELLNYFNLKTEPQQDGKKQFTLNSQLTACPWNNAHRLLFINLQAGKINLENTPPANLVFLIDASGSMDMPNKMPIIKAAFRLLTDNLRSKDLVSIVTYGDKVTVLLEPTHGNNKQTIIAAIEGLVPSGPTPGASAIKTAYNIARQNFINNGNNRVILATDGDFNVGEASEKELENLIGRESKSGIYLTCLGVGMGNYKDSKLETLSKSGNGNLSYLDTEKEAEKTLIEEFAKTLYSVADNVHLQIDFDKTLIKQYRLIGFDNKKSAIANKTFELQGGEIGSGHSVIAAFEIVSKADSGDIRQLATVTVSYNLPGKTEILTKVFPIYNNYRPINDIDKCLSFAASVIMFGSMLKQSAYKGTTGWDDIAVMANNSAEAGNMVQKEFIELIIKAKKLYGNRKKR